MLPGESEVKRNVILLLVFVSYAQTLSAAPLSAAQIKCLAKIDEQVDFIIYGIERVNQQYEEIVKEKKLDEFKSGEYSADVFLDKSIRKYRLELTGEIKSYPQRYIAIQKKSAGNSRCIASQLQSDGVGIIHNFEVTWQKAIENANKNRKFFQSVESLQ